MIYHVRFSERSENTLAAIYAYIAADSPENAERFLSRFRQQVVQFLDTPPNAGRAYKQHQRFMTFDRYVVLYEVKDTQVTVIDIFPPGKNWRV